MRLRFTNRSTPSGPVADVFVIDDPDPAGFDYETGWGFVNGEAALNTVPAAATTTVGGGRTRNGELSEDDVADVLSVSVITVKRDWKVGASIDGVPLPCGYAEVDDLICSRMDSTST